MKRVSRTALIALALAVLIPSLATAWVQDPTAGSDLFWPGFCNPSGTWLGTTRSSGAVTLVTIVPARFGTFSILGTSIADDPSFGGALPAVAASPGRSLMRKTGPLAYSNSGIRFGWDADLAVVWIERSEAVVVFTQQCDSVAVEGLYHYYGAWQDPFGEEAPAYGSYPGGADYERLPG